MKKSLCLLIVLVFVQASYGQFERQWSSALVSDYTFTDVNAVHLINEQIVFNQVSYHEDHSVALNELKIYSLTGVELWSFNWSEIFPLHARIEIFPLSTEQVYFVVNDSHADGVDYYGVINLFDEIVWQNTLLMNSQILVTTLETNLLIDFSKYDEVNELLLVDKDGNETWLLEDGAYESRNTLVSNKKDKAIWLNSKGLGLIDMSNQILDRDSLSNYLNAYSHFEVQENEVIALKWDPFNFIIKKYSNTFQSSQIDTLGYAFNIFGTPHPTIISETNGNTFVSSDYTYDGASFIIKYDDNLEKQWVVDSEDKIVNVFPDDEEVIVIDANTINVLSNMTGALIYETAFEANEILLSIYTKNEIFDAPKESLYVFTSLDSTSYLSQYKKTLTSTINLQQENKISLYPVPVTDKLFVKNNSEFNAIQIYNVSGQLLLNSKNTKGYINTESLPQGTYILQLTNQFNTTSSKFIKM